MKGFWCILVALLVVAKGGALEEVSFSRDIRPLLSDRCFKCHGFDEETKEADLGLHSFSEATRDLGGYRAIVPGDADASELVARIISEDRDEVMPPPTANKPRFSPEEVDLMRRWIEQGAKYEKHWAFVKPVKPAVPQGNVPHPIDRFLDEAIDKQGLERNEEADPYTLVRRLSFDLRGLPPTPEEIAGFVANYQKDSEEAWKTVVDDFLKSPAYGERWARDWLDLARYADTNGYEKDRPRSIWPYRDWVVRALNEDQPYDQFTIEQIAGDMLTNPTIEQLIATGFHRNTMLNEEGGIDPLEFRYHAMVDRVATTGSVWMGLTTGCAQCHTHKFDPITHTDYFSLMALLNNADELEIAVPDASIAAQQQSVEKQMGDLEKEAREAIDPAKFDAWVANEQKRAVDWIPLEPKTMKSNLPFLEKQEDFSIYSSGDFTKRDVFDLVFDLGDSKSEENITAIRIEAIPDSRLPAGGPGTVYYEGRKGDFFLSEVTVAVDGAPVEFRASSVSFGKIAVGSGSAEGSNVYDGDGSTGWSTATQEGKRNELVLNLKKPIPAKGNLDFQMLFERHFVAALGRFRISVATNENDAVAMGYPFPDFRKASREEKEKAYLRSSPDFADFQKKIAALEKKSPAFPTTLVFQERPTENPRQTYLHHRGEYLSKREEVSPAPPAIFDPIPEDLPKNRLGLAHWLVSDGNPLGARVAVNRAWRAFFGTGIVKTSGDFGYQSELPAHPELLDWLAVSLVEGGWSMKSLHRQIVTSAAYRRDSAISSLQREQDPDNRFLARGPRFRLTGEMIRDAALRSAGLLSSKQGGPGVFPPQPKSVVAMAYGNTAWNVSKGEDRYRRSLYTFAKRTSPFAAYLVFDGPTGESCLPRRDRSNTPLQALTLLNDPMFGEAAVALGMKLGGDATGLSVVPNRIGSNDRIGELFLRILSRPPTDLERRSIEDYYKKQIARFEAGELNPAAILGETGKDPTAEKAAWTMVARVLLNLNEAVTRG